jgi:tRNA dimethylallyltransferase
MPDPLPRIVILLGPTAVGKTAVSIPLARALDAEILSADSRQVYVGMDIGTAKPTASERGGIRHHLLDIVHPRDEFTVAEFQRLAFETIGEILGRGKAVLVVGGTGLYIRALIDRPGYQDQPPLPELRREILEEIAGRGAQAVYDELSAIDPSAAQKIHPNNIPRLVRAMEIIRATGRKFSDAVEHDRATEKESPYDWILIGLNTDRERLYDRINRRVVKMIHSGWIEEVKNLLESGCCGDERPLKGLGYREIVQYVRGQKTLDSALELIKRDTRRFAKRQMTFFRRLEPVHWMELDPGTEPAMIAGRIMELVSEHGHV